jgi:FixJ family two-component response regulator
MNKGEEKHDGYYTCCWTITAAFTREREAQALDDDPGPASSSSEGLTKRELEVLVLLVQELTYVQIAQQMGL